MGNFTLQIPELGNKFIDFRQQILGDSFNWSWVRPLSQPQYLVIHHSAGPATQTPNDIARYHVQTRGWGGVGYHFIIVPNGTVYYVGDLTTARANVANKNELVIGICLIGTFMNGQMPNDNQLRSTHLLCAHLLFQTPELSQVDRWEDVVGHQQLGQTACPGDTWATWRQKLVTYATDSGGTDSMERRTAISQLYRTVLGREPDADGLQYYVSSSWSIEQICKLMAESPEHQRLLNKASELKQAQQKAAEVIPLLQQAYPKLLEITSLP